MYSNVFTYAFKLHPLSIPTYAIALWSLDCTLHRGQRKVDRLGHFEMYVYMYLEPANICRYLSGTVARDFLVTATTRLLESLAVLKYLFRGHD
jgi:hypothetical protein